jgi:anti-sigma-K factor RskA
MTCGELRPDYTSFALGIAEDPERTAIAEHLARKCPECLLGMASAMATVTALSGAVPLKEPPPHLRRRVMAGVSSAPARSRAAVFVPWALTAVMSAGLVAVGISGRRQIGDTRKLERALTILNDPATRDQAFGAPGKPGASGHVFVNPGKGVVFIGAGLPSIGADKTFELWIRPIDGAPTPTGLFRSQPDDTAVFVWPGPAANAAAIEVTVEPQGGSAKQAATPFMVVKF